MAYLSRSINNTLFAADTVLSTHFMHYEDIGFHVAIFKGGIAISKIFPFNGSDSGSWFYTTKNSSEFTDIKAATNEAGWFALERDKKILTFPNTLYNDSITGHEFTGDLWYLVTDKSITAMIVNRTGQLSAKMIFKHSISNPSEKRPRVMAIDNNLILYSKQINVYQFQGFKFQEKPAFGPLKDIEDITITRESGLRLFKTKGGKNKFKLFSTMPSSDWNPYIEGVSRKNLLNEEGYTNITFLDAKYGNVVVMANTGKHYKYFIVASTNQAKGAGQSLEFVETFNTSKTNYTDVTETSNYLFIWRPSPPDLIAIPKNSNYKAMRSNVSQLLSATDKIVDISSEVYRSEFLPNINLTKILLRVERQAVGSNVTFAMVPLNLSNIVVECDPLTYLLSFLEADEQKKITFSIMGVNDEFAYIPDIRFTFNAYYIYSYSGSGTVFWLWIWLSINIVLLVFAFRSIRLGLKRRKQTMGFRKLNEVMKGMAPLVTTDMIEKTLKEDAESRMKRRREKSKQKRREKVMTSALAK